MDITYLLPPSKFGANLKPCIGIQTETIGIKTETMMDPIRAINASKIWKDDKRCKTLAKEMISPTVSPHPSNDEASMGEENYCVQTVMCKLLEDIWVIVSDFLVD